MTTPDMEEVLHVSSYHLLEPMGFYTDIYDVVTKMRASTLLRYIFRLHQRKKSAEYLVVILASDNQESFSRDARDKDWVDEIILHSPGGNEENKVAMAQNMKPFLLLLNVGCL